MMIKTDGFFGVHNHTEFSNIGSFKDSTIKVKDLMLRAQELGHQGVAITDHANIAAHIQAIQQYKQLQKEEILHESFKLGLGVEGYVVDKDEMNEAVSNNQSTTFYHLVLIAKDAIGHRQIRELTTRAYKRSFTYRGILRVPMFYEDFEQVIGREKGHLIVSSACLGGFLGKIVTDMLKFHPTEREGHKQRIYEFMCWALDLFGEDFYLELQPSFNEEQVAYNQMLINIAKAYQVPFIIATDSHYLRPEDKQIHASFLTSDEKGKGGRELGSFYDDTFLHSVEEMRHKMAYMSEEDFNQAIYHTSQIAQKITFYDLKHDPIIPKIPLPPKNQWQKHTDLEELAKSYEYIYEMMTNEEPYDQYLIQLIFDGMKEKNVPVEKYPDKLARINIECKELIGTTKAKKQPISSYFVTFHKTMELMWEEVGAILGVSRGSAGGYLINYYLNITMLDPTEYKVELPHWRFIHSSRPDYPDIDCDIPSHLRDKAFSVIQQYLEGIGGEIVRVSTFGTETAKSAILTACRGLGIDSDTAKYLSSLIPVVRGKVSNLHRTYYGDENNPPVAEFVNICNQYQHLNLIETALGVEGLVNKASIHAAGVIITNEKFTEHNSVMVAPNGSYISSWNLSESEYAGGIKYDHLNTRTMSMIQRCMEMLVEAGYMKWQGSLKKTYDKYLHPSVLELEDPKMWEKLNRHEVISLFQFETTQGHKAIEAIKPASLAELAAANTLMRLATETGEQPMDKYVRFKNDISQWYSEMRDFGLNEEEIKILEDNLLHVYGVMQTQEEMMIMCMDERVACFDVVEANILRKSVAKGKGDLFQQSKNLFFEKGLANGCREIFLKYIWTLIELQKNYSFSVLHTYGYSLIAITILNLVHRFPPIFWACAVLQVEAGAIEQENLEDEEEQGNKEKTSNYGALATAISMLQQNGIKIEAPSINRANIGFSAIEKTNSILYGLKGITKLNNETAKAIIENRPYHSFNDFVERLVETKQTITQEQGKSLQKSLVTKAQLISLIKAGAFDEVEPNLTREELMNDYLKSQFKGRTAVNDKFVQEVVALGLVKPSFETSLRHMNFRTFLKTLPKESDPVVKAIKWIIIDTGNAEQDEYTENYFLTHFSQEMVEGRDYGYNSKGQLMIAMGTRRKGSFEDVLAKLLAEFNAWLKSDECLKKYNEIMFEEYRQKLAAGTIQAWEMESLSIYLDKHETEVIEEESHGFTSFSQLPEEPIIVGYNQYKGRQLPKYQLSRLVGCVVDKNKNKHTISLLTREGVVTIKLHANNFTFFDKTISMINPETNKKVVLEESWLKKGVLLAITGFRQQDQFKPRTYSDSIIKHSIQRLSFDRNQRLVIQEERIKINER